MSREYFTADPLRPFADAVLVDGKTLYISGRIGLIAGTTKVPETMEEEAHLIMQDLQWVLAMAGISLEDLVSLQVFASDVSLWKRFNSVYRDYFKGQLPPRAFLSSGTLLFGARFELQGSPSRADRSAPEEGYSGAEKDGVPAPLYCLNFGGRYFAHNANRLIPVMAERSKRR